MSTRNQNNGSQSVTQFESFPENRQAPQRKQREAYIPPNLPKVTNPGAGYKPERKPTVMGLDNTSGIPADLVPHLQQPSMTGHVVPTSSPDAVSIDLPTNFLYYNFKDLYVVPFRGIHLAKISRSHTEKSLLHMVEAVSSVLSNSQGDKHIAFKLSIADFYYVLYWLRTNSYTKSVYIHTAYCTNPDHHARIDNGELPGNSLANTTTIHKTNLKTNYLEALPEEGEFELEYPGVSLRAPTMQDTLDLVTDPRFEDPETAAEYQYLAQLAAYLWTGEETSLQERIAIINDMSPDDITTLRRYETFIAEFGVVESVNVNCKACGASWVSKLTLDAHDFLPSN